VMCCAAFCVLPGCRPAATHPRWKAELEQLSPSSLVQLLTASESRLLRLRFLADAGRQEAVALYAAVVTFPGGRFAERFPAFTAWAHKRGA
jgi:hypothetical protein